MSQTEVISTIAIVVSTIAIAINFLTLFIPKK